MSEGNKKQISGKTTLSIECGHNQYKKILIVGSGSLHNPTLVNQGKEIPAISHLVKIEVLL